MILGAFVIVYNLFTDYELGLVRFLRVRFHLLLDAIFGKAMLCTPWLLDLPAASRMPIGALALLLVLTTKVRAQGTHSHATI